jgi:hypothetical protein
MNRKGNWSREHNRMALEALAAASVVFLAVACKSSSVKVSGIVTDSTGTVLSGVQVSLGSSVATTSSNGKYTLEVPPQTGAVIQFSVSGYLPSSKAVDVTSGATNYLDVALMALATPQPLDAMQGGTITGAAGAALTVGSGVLVDGNGNAVTGSVQVSLTPLNPAVPGELAAYPGSLAGSVNGAPATLLQTYGVLDVTVTQNGQELQIASGQTATVSIPATAKAGASLPPTQDLWSFNLTTGIWDHEGTAQLAASGSAYTAQLSHFSYHNIDASILAGQATCITGTVVSASGKPVADAYVSPSQGASTDTLIQTNANGQYCTWIVSGQSETLTGDSTGSPYGEGSITVTGGAPMTFPGSYTCSNLNCQSVPNIVLSQPPCTSSSDCQGGTTCCAVNGQNMCLQSFACLEAVSGSKPASNCTPGTTVTATVEGQTFAWDCFIAEYVSVAVNQLTVTGANSSGDQLQLDLYAPSGQLFTQGATLDIGGDAGTQVVLYVSGKLGDGGVFGTTAISGTLTLTQWTGTGGSQVVLTIANVKTTAGFLPCGAPSEPGTISGTITVASLTAL